MASTISAGTTTTTALVYSADTSGVLQLQTNGGTTAVTIDTNQNLGIGTSSPSGRLDVVTASGSTYINARRNSQSSGEVGLNLYGGTSGQNWGIYIPQSSNDLRFYTNGADRVSIDSSGNLLVGATSQTQGGKIFSSFNQSTNQGITLQNTNSSNSAYFVYMLNSAGNAAGSITQSGATSVNYGSGSDYRLKENIQPMTGALAKVNQLNPVTFDWIADKTQGQGFIAHELQVVVPECVYGEKDAVDSEGNLKYQMVDQSKLVGVLTAAIQELSAQVTTLQTQVTALKG